MEVSNGCDFLRRLEDDSRIHRGDGDLFDLFDYCNFGVEAANDAENVSVAYGIRSRPKNLSKLILEYRNVYNHIASDV